MTDPRLTRVTGLVVRRMSRVSDLLVRPRTPPSRSRRVTGSAAPDQPGVIVVRLTCSVKVSVMTSPLSSLPALAPPFDVCTS